MKRFSILATVVVLGILIVTACKKEYFNPDNFAGGSFKPSVAVPLADLSISVDDILKRWETNVLQEYDPSVSSGTDSVFFLQLIYTDSLDPADLGQFGTGGVIAPIPVPLPTEKVNLRIFETFDNGDFRLTNPSVRFNITNTSEYAFDLEFRDGDNADLYTEKQVNGQAVERRDLEITDADHPYTIPARVSSSTAGELSFTLNNDNIRYVADPNDLEPMSSVLEPTPKFLYYGVTLTPQSSGTNTGGVLNLTAEVLLPLEGYGNITYFDTLNYSFVNEEEASQLNFAELRLIVDNGMPLEAVISAIVVDSVNFDTIMELPIYENGDPKSSGMIVGAAAPGPAPDYRPAEANTELSDIALYNVDPNTGERLDQIQKLAKGNKIILKAVVQTTDYSNQQTVKMYSDYRMRVRLGVRAQASLDAGELIDEFRGNE